MHSRLWLAWRRLTLLVQKEIWQTTYLRDTSAKGRLFAVLRVVSITLTGLAETRATSRAAALSFSSLLGLAPLIGLAVLVAGFSIGSNNTELVTEKLNQLLRFIAPQVVVYEDERPPSENTRVDGEQPPPQVTVEKSSIPGRPTKVAVNPELVTFINNAIAATRDSAGTKGLVSTLSLLFIVLLLFTSVEQAFNDIWGVRRGRSWLVRIVSYWTILTLGALLFFGLSATTLVGLFRERLPWGSHIADALTISGPLLSVLLLLVLLTLFYRFIPNTHVGWQPALIGATLVSLLLVLNHVLAFAYIERVGQQRSLFGSLALLPVLMFGLYVFWLFVLIGGQISYAVQNVHYRNSQAAWSSLSEFTRERLTLAVLLAIARRFQACLPPCTVSELGSTIRVPTQVLNECLNRLVDLKLVSPVPPDPTSGASDYLYQPARPLNRITLQHFKHSFENFGHDPASEGIRRLDPIIERYQTALEEMSQTELFTTSLDQLFAKYSFELVEPRDHSDSAKKPA